MSGKTNIDYHLENLPWIEQQVLREIYKAIGYYNSHGAQFESPTDVFYGIRTNVLKIVDAMNDPRAEGGQPMTTNDETRTALVEELNSRARTMFDTATRDLLDGAEWTKSDRYDFYTMLADQLTEEAVEMFEKMLTDRAVPEHAAAGDDLDFDMTLAYIKGWQDGQDALRKSVDAAVLDSVAKAKESSDADPAS